LKKLSARDKTLLAKYMIELGASKIDIIHCLVKNGVEAHETLLLIELLILTKEVIRNKNDELSLAQKLEPIPEPIVRIARECLESKDRKPVRHSVKRA
jgi:hypothetical protein